MAELNYGELFDLYGRKLLAHLHENRGRWMPIKEVGLVKLGGLTAVDPLMSSEEEALHREAALRALIWLRDHGYTEQQIKEGKDAVVEYRITPSGILLYGRPVLGGGSLSFA